MTLAASLLEGYGYNGVVPSDNTTIVDPILYLQEACIEAVNALYEASQQYYIADIIGQVEVVTESNGNVEAIQESAGSKLKQIWEAFKRKVKAIIDGIISKIRKVIQWIRNKLFGKSKDENGSVEKTYSSLIKEIETFDPTKPAKPGKSPSKVEKSQRKSSHHKMNYDNFKEDESPTYDEPLIINMPNGNIVEVDTERLDNDTVPITNILNQFQMLIVESTQTLETLDEYNELCDQKFEDLRKFIDHIKSNGGRPDSAPSDVAMDYEYNVNSKLEYVNEKISRLAHLLNSIKSEKDVICVNKSELAKHVDDMVKIDREIHKWVDTALNKFKEKERQFQMFQKEIDSINPNDYDGLESKLNEDVTALINKISTYISGYMSMVQCSIRAVNFNSIIYNEELKIIKCCWDAYKSYMSKHNK